MCRMVHLGNTQSWYQQSMNQIHYCCLSAYGIFRYVKPSTTYEFVELQNTSCWALVEGFHIFFYIANTILMGCQKEYAWKFAFEIYEESSFKYFPNFLFWLLKVCFPLMLILWKVCLVHKIRILHHRALPTVSVDFSFFATKNGTRSPSVWNFVGYFTAAAFSRVFSCGPNKTGPTIPLCLK